MTATADAMVATGTPFRQIGPWVHRGWFTPTCGPLRAGQGHTWNGAHVQEGTK